MCVLPTASVLEASVTRGAARGCFLSRWELRRPEDRAVQNCGPLAPGLRKMRIIASGLLAWKMWGVGVMALASGLLEANLAWPSPFWFFFLCSCCFKRPRQAGWILSKGLSGCAFRCQVKGQPEDGSERKPSFFWKQPSEPA